LEFFIAKAANMLPVIISNVAHICTNMFSKNHLCGSLINDGISEIGYFG
jgi:hypothetical protein